MRGGREARSARAVLMSNFSNGVNVETAVGFSNVLMSNSQTVLVNVEFLKRC